MANSPLRSPFKSIANCVVRVFNWSEKGDSISPTKNLDKKKSDDDEVNNKSRSVSPEIPKLEEPGQYKWQPDAQENSPEKSGLTRKSSRIQSGPSSPKTPRSTTKKCSKIESGPSTPKTPRSTRSAQIESGPPSPKTPRSTTKRTTQVQSGPPSPKTPRSTSKRSAPIQSGPPSPKTPRSTSKRSAKIQSGPPSPNTPRSTSKRSAKVQSGPTSPKTPRSALKKSALAQSEPSSPKTASKKSLVFNIDDKELHKRIVEAEASKRSTRPRSTPATPKDTPKTPDRTKRETKTSKIKKQEIVSSDEGQSPEDQRRSTRVRTPKRFYDDPDAPKTPDDSNDEDFQIEKFVSHKKVVTTPKTPRTPKTPKGSAAKNSLKMENSGPQTPKTPRSNAKKSLVFSKKSTTSNETSQDYERDTPAKRRRTMTPRVPARTVPIGKDKSSLEEAQRRLHVGAVPDSLPCRDNEFTEIEIFTRTNICCGTGGCMYISGVPGTGKTATVKEVIRKLQRDCDAGDLPNFQFIEINGMRLTEPNQLYVYLWKALGGSKVTTEHAKNLLAKRFTTPPTGSGKSKKNKETIVVLVDELDLLWNRKQSVLYNIFEWPNNEHARLVVLAIANTMDLPERVMINRVSSRIGLTRLTFSPYTHQQLQEIVTARLSGLSVFDNDAIQLVSRKVASLSGDARRALDICRRATEIAQAEQTKTSKSSVTIKHVMDAHKEMFCSPKILAICYCSKYEKIFLQSIVAVFTKIGIEEAPLDRVIKAMNEVLKFENLELLSIDQAHNVVGRLTATKLVLVEPGKSGRLDMKLRLNVSPDDVHFALRDENTHDK